MGWLWMNVPLMIVFFLCWAAIPLYLVLTRWHREVEARHAEVAAWHAQLSARDAQTQSDLVPVAVPAQASSPTAETGVRVPADLAVGDRAR